MFIAASPLQPAPELKPVEVRYEQTWGLPALLEQLEQMELSVLLSTHQAGRVVSVCSHRGELPLGFSYFDHAFGLCRRASVIAVGSLDAIWTLPANREIAARIKPEGEHDIAFLLRSCLHSGPLMGHDKAWRGRRLQDFQCYLPSREVLLETGLSNLRGCIEFGSLSAGVIRVLAQLRISWEMVLGWLLPTPTASG